MHAYSGSMVDYIQEQNNVAHTHTAADIEHDMNTTTTIQPMYIECLSQGLGIKEDASVGAETEVHRRQNAIPWLCSGRNCISCPYPCFGGSKTFDLRDDRDDISR